MKNDFFNYLNKLENNISETSQNVKKKHFRNSKVFLTIKVFFMIFCAGTLLYYFAPKTESVKLTKPFVSDTSYGASVRVTTTQTLPDGWSYNKIQFGTKDWDFANEFDNVTNYRYTATVAGYYQINLKLRYTNTQDDCYIGDEIRKNGVGIHVYYTKTRGTAYNMTNDSYIVYLGVGDYLEGFAVSGYVAPQLDDQTEMQIQLLHR